jgi:hypothetical protein
MNSFANSLFSLLFGWARTLIQHIWTAAISGRYGGFFTWLGDHWVWLALILCLGCTAMDFLIWLIRWRPYLVWRSYLRRLGRLFRREKPESARRFERGYQGGVELGMPQEEEMEKASETIPQEQWEEEDWAAAPEESALEEETPPPAWTDAPAYPEPPAQAPSFSQTEAQEEERSRYFAPPAAYEPPPMYVSSRAQMAYTSDMPVARRRRRSEKYERRRPDWREKLIKGDEDEDALLDGLPPAVDRQQAFHEPVYPRQSAGENAYAAWRRPAPGNQSTDGHA